MLVRNPNTPYLNIRPSVVDISCRRKAKRLILEKSDSSWSQDPLMIMTAIDIQAVKNDAKTKPMNRYAPDIARMQIN